MTDSFGTKIFRVILNLYPIFSMGYGFYVYYYFLSKTGGYYQGKLPETGEKLLRTYVDHPLMASSESLNYLCFKVTVLAFN